MGKAEFHYLSNHLRELVNPSNEYICSQGYTIPLSNSPPRVRGKRINRHPRFLPRNANVFIAGTFHGGDKQNRSALLSLIPKPRINVPPGGEDSRGRGKLDVKRFAVTIKARYRSGGGLDVKYRGEEEVEVEVVEQVEFSFPLLDRIYSGVIRVVSRLRPERRYRFRFVENSVHLFLGDSLRATLSPSTPLSCLPLSTSFLPGGTQK